MKLCQFLLGALVAAALILPAHADPVLFPGSQIVTRDRFSDEIVGSGPDIVFIPGLASSRETWKVEAARLKDHYRVHLIQVAGFAGEPARANANGPMLTQTADDIDAYLKEAHLTPATVIGHSLGGTMVLYLAEIHPGDLKKGMLVDALPFYSTLMLGPQANVAQATPIADKVRANPASAMGGARYDVMMKSMATSEADRAMIMGWGKLSNAPTVANAVADDMTLDLRPGLSKITIPLTLIHPDYTALGAPAGSTDAMYRADYAAVPGMTIVEAKNSLHFIMLDQPAQLEAALDAFLSK